MFGKRIHARFTSQRSSAGTIYRGAALFPTVSRLGWDAPHRGVPAPVLRPAQRPTARAALTIPAP
jgi:hypothetical protein